VAAHIALTGVSDHLHVFNSIITRRQKLICERLDSLTHVFSYIKSEGAYYIFPRILIEHENSRGFALQLLNKARVAVTPGSDFGPSGEHHVRMAYCVSEDVINLAFDRIQAYFKV
jgi:aspartate/methionine/tyrosine aminotransferase